MTTWHDAEARLAELSPGERAAIVDVAVDALGGEILEQVEPALPGTVQPDACGDGAGLNPRNPA